MTEKEEIRKGMKKLQLQTFDGITYYLTNSSIMTILDYLKSEGLVIRVERELPEPPPRCYPVHIDWRDGQRAMLEAGCGFFEPLIRRNRK